MVKWIEETYTWCRANRPDLVQHLDNIVALERNHDDRGRAMMLLLSVGFRTGLEFALRDKETAAKVANYEI